MRMRGRGVAQKAKLKMQSVGSSSKPQILTDFSGIICPDRLEEPRSPRLRPWGVVTSAQGYNMNRLPDEARGRCLHRIHRVSEDP